MTDFSAITQAVSIVTKALAGNPTATQQFFYLQDQLDAARWRIAELERKLANLKGDDRADDLPAKPTDQTV